MFLEERHSALFSNHSLNNDHVTSHRPVIQPSALFLLWVKCHPCQCFLFKCFCLFVLFKIFFYCCLFPGCEEVPDSWPQHECDIMVSGQQLWHTPPVATGDDLCRPGRLRANAAGVWLCTCSRDTVEKTCALTLQTPAECLMWILIALHYNPSKMLRSFITPHWCLTGQLVT